MFFPLTPDPKFNSDARGDLTFCKLYRVILRDCARVQFRLLSGCELRARALRHLLNFKIKRQPVAPIRTQKHERTYARTHARSSYMRPMNDGSPVCLFMYRMLVSPTPFPSCLCHPQNDVMRVRDDVRCHASRRAAEVREACNWRMRVCVHMSHNHNYNYQRAREPNPKPYSRTTGIISSQIYNKISCARVPTASKQPI